MSRSTRNRKGGGGGGGQTWVEVNFFAKAKHSYKGNSESKELSFKKGQHFRIFSEAQGWYKAHFYPEQEGVAPGMIPGNYVKKVDAPPGATESPSAAKTDSPVAAVQTAKATKATKATIAVVSPRQQQMARASRRRGQTVDDMESEKALRAQLSKLQSELKNVEYQHTSALQRKEIESQKIRDKLRKAEDRVSLLESKVEMLEDLPPPPPRSPDMAEVKKLEKKITKLERALERAREERDAQMAKNTEGQVDNEQVETLKAEAKKWKEKCATLADEVDDLKDEIDELENGPGAAPEPASAQEPDPEVLAEMEHNKKEVKRLLAAENTLLKEIQELEARDELKSAEMEKTLASNESLLEELAEAQEQTRVAQEACREAEAETDELQLKVKELEASAGGFDESSAAELVAAQAELTSVRGENQELTGVIAAHGEELEKVQMQLEEQREASDVKIKELQKQLQAAQQAGENLKKIRKNLVGIIKENDVLLTRVEQLNEKLA